MKKTTIILFLALIVFFVSAIIYSSEACEPRAQSEVFVYFSGQTSDLHKSFELRVDGPFFDPYVIVVNEGDILDITFMFKDIHYISIGKYVNDYYTVGSATFKPEKGEYAIECRDCMIRSSGFLIVR